MTSAVKSMVSIDDYTTYIGLEHLDKISTATSICFDCETLQLRPEMGKLRLLQLGSTARRAVVVIDLYEEEDALHQLDLFFQNGSRFWLAQNAVFDLAWLQEYGWYPKGQIRDSMFASRLLSNGLPNLKHSLAAICQRHLGIELDKTQQRSDWSGNLSTEQITYAAKDVAVLCELDDVLHRKVAEAGLGKAYSLECRALPAMAQMARTGLPWDREALEGVERDYGKDVENLGREVLMELDAALPEGEKLPRDEDGSINTSYQNDRFDPAWNEAVRRLQHWVVVPATEGTDDNPGQGAAGSQDEEAVCIADCIAGICC